MTDEITEDVTEGTEESTVETVVEETAETSEQKAAGTSEATSEESAEDVQEKAFAWPETWQQELANEFADGDEKAAAKALKTLSRYKSPAAMFSKIREQEDYLRSGGLVKIPGKDATEDDIANFHKALGVPDKAEDYIENLELGDGLQLGDDDRENATWFAEMLREAGAPQEVYNKVVGSYLALESQQAEALTKLDDADEREADKVKREAYGPRYEPSKVAVKTSLEKSKQGLHDNLMGGRLADGTLIANSPDVFNYLVEQGKAADEHFTVIAEDLNPGGVSVDDRLKEIDKYRREDKRAYFKDEKVQEEERRLIALQQRLGS